MFQLDLRDVSEERDRSFENHKFAGQLRLQAARKTLRKAMEKLFPHNADETVAVRVAAEVDECHATGKPPDTGYAPTNFEIPAGVRKEPFVIGCLDDCGDRVGHPGARDSPSSTLLSPRLSLNHSEMGGELAGPSSIRMIRDRFRTMPYDR